MKTLVKAVAALVVATAVVPVSASPSTYPDKPIRLVVPFAPGGGADFSARRIGQPLADYLGQSIVIENVPGAGGTMGANRVAKATPDGYTLLYTTPGQQMTAAYLIENLPYDPMKDLRPVSQLTAGKMCLVAMIFRPRASRNSSTTPRKTRERSTSRAPELVQRATWRASFSRRWLESTLSTCRTRDRAWLHLMSSEVASRCRSTRSACTCHIFNPGP